MFPFVNFLKLTISCMLLIQILTSNLKILATIVSAKVTDNPADDLVIEIQAEENPVATMEAIPEERQSYICSLYIFFNI